MYKAYKRFPPTDYSTLIELKMEGQSNVNWGMMAFLVNNNIGSFYDMLAERGTACDIQTKIGNFIERRVYSELISLGYDQYALREDYNYLMGAEMDILDMALYGKGIQMHDRKDSYQSDHVPVHEFYVPEDTPISLDEFDMFMRKRKYRLHQLFDCIKDREKAEKMGWNVDAVIDAMRMKRDDWKGSSTEEFMHDLVAGRRSLSDAMKERVHVYDLYIKELGDEEISRHMVLQDYEPFFSLVNEKIKDGKTLDDVGKGDILDSQGFLFSKLKYEENVRRIVSVFFDRTGSGDWHDTPSLAEEVFVQCRQYDIIMNSIMDAIKLNMTLILQGSTPEATERLKAMVWGQFAILPSDTPFVQQRTQLATVDATQTLQFMMSDLYSGIGHYRIQDRAPKGDSPTATQRQLDAAESAKLSGTQIRRFNEQQTVHHKEKFRRFVSLTEGCKGYEQFEKFKDEMREMGVPAKAYEFKNIRSITSNMIAGPGSPSYKLMAAEKIIALTNITPKDDGQRAAIEDAIAAIASRQNVSRYMPPKKRMDPEWEERMIGFECETFSDPMLNPRNLAAFPDDNHVKHIDVHLNDMSTTVIKLEEAIKAGTLEERVAFPAMTRLMHEGAHTAAHLKFLALDKGKEPILKEFQKGLFALQRSVEKVQGEMKKIQDAKQQGKPLDPNDPDLQKQLAMDSMKLDTERQLADIKIASISRQHQLREEITRDKAATDLAVKRAGATVDIENKKRAAKASENGKPAPKKV